MHWILVLLLSGSAWAKSDLQPEQSYFRQVCRENRAESNSLLTEAPDVDVSSYFPVNVLEASQSRFSYRRFLTAMKKAVGTDAAEFAHDHGRALFPMDKKIKAVFYRGKLFIVDGHHRALISAYLGAKSIPVQILADLSELPPHEFPQRMEERGWAYWQDHQNRRSRLRDLCDMLDDPNFQLARLIIRRVKVGIDNGKLNMTDSTGAEILIAVKINADIPFFEIHIADALRRGGVEFDDRRTAADISKRELAKLLRILRAEAADKSWGLSQVLLLDKPRNVAKLNLEQIVFKHMRERLCEHNLQ